MRRLMMFFAYLWAGPNTIAAVAIGILLFGRFRMVDGVIEIEGDRVCWALSKLPMPARAMTMGHVVFGRDQFSLRITRDHERVHVRQYERWGPMFIPLYLLISVLLYARRRDGYLQNPFEIEAFAVDTPTFRGALPNPDETFRG